MVPNDGLHPIPPPTSISNANTSDDANDRIADASPTVHAHEQTMELIPTFIRHEDVAERKVF